jgi:hypothetical protein
MRSVFGLTGQEDDGEGIISNGLGAHPMFESLRQDESVALMFFSPPCTWCRRTQWHLGVEITNSCALGRAIQCRQCPTRQGSDGGDFARYRCRQDRRVSTLLPLLPSDLGTDLEAWGGVLGERRVRGGPPPHSDYPLRIGLPKQASEPGTAGRFVFSVLVQSNRLPSCWWHSRRPG